MRIKLLLVVLVATLLAGGASAAVIVEKRSRQLPFVEVFECPPLHAFVFRGPTGTSRKPILVPPKEFWVAREAGLYKFIVRYHSGNVCSRLVTPEVFARYQVGDDFRDSEPASERMQVQDSKSVALVVPQRKHTARMTHRTHKRQIAKHHRTNRSRVSHRIASR
jgi:hypothetical protein